jgi:hypothetical protein
MAETATLNRFVNVMFSGGMLFANNQQFTTAMLLDGNEDTVCDLCIFNGDGGATDGAAKTDLQWQVPGGNVQISHSFFGGVVNLFVWAQNIGIDESTVSSIKISGTCALCGDILSISNSYLANNQGAGLIQLNGQTLSVTHITGCTVGLSSTVALYTGTGTVNNAGFASNVWSFGTSSIWNSGGATLTKQTTDGGNHVRILNATPTSFPFTLDGNNNF